jgi:hypothetical protein
MGLPKIISMPVGLDFLGAASGNLPKVLMKMRHDFLSLAPFEKSLL